MVGWLGFGASVIESVAWPLAIAFLLWPCRKPVAEAVKDLLGRLKHLKVPGGAASFFDSKAQELVAATTGQAPSEAEAPRASKGRWVKLELPQGPELSIMEVIADMDRDLRTRLRAAGRDDEAFTTFVTLSDAAVEAGALEPHLKNALPEVAHLLLLMMDMTTEERAARSEQLLQIAQQMRDRMAANDPPSMARDSQ